MPKIDKPSTNGHAKLAHRPEFVQALKRTLTGTDDIRIGTDGPAPSGEEEPCGATMADVAERVSSVKYLVRGWVPYGMLTGIVAEPGVGKSAFALYALARPIITGCNWFTGAKGPSKPGKVLWCSTENDAALTIDRIKKWGIPPERIILPFADDPLGTVNLLDDAHLQLIEALINRYRTPAFFIDSLRGAHDGDENNSRVGRILQCLSGISERTHAAAIVNHHTRKLMVDEEITANSSRGSNAILAMMRAQIGIDKPDPNSKWCRVRVLKENLGIAPEPIGFRVTNKGLDFGPSPEKPHRETEKDRAETWLRNNMEPGQWLSAVDLLDEAEQFGFSKNAVQRAREAIGIVKPNYVRKTKAGWEWNLPKASRETQETGG